MSDYLDYVMEMEREKEKRRLARRKTIAIDFDGVIHRYSQGWQDGSIYDKETTHLTTLFNALLKSYNVFIFSTRNPRQIKRWLKSRMLVTDHIINHPDLVVIKPWTKFWVSEKAIGITKRKLPAIAYIDDRALPFNGSWADIYKKLKIK
jgi:hypothetical protein